tara:strand:+ start:3166 stop:3312 length:147 start_codon:yes stop_codon:yes gene_type:complete
MSEPKDVEEDLQGITEDELLSNWRARNWNWLWYAAVFMVAIVIGYYMF